MKQGLKLFYVCGVTTTQGTVVKGCRIRKVESHCPRGNTAFLRSPQQLVSEHDHPWATETQCHISLELGKPLQDGVVPLSFLCHAEQVMCGGGCTELQSLSLTLRGVRWAVHHTVPGLALMRDQGSLFYTGSERHFHFILQSSELGLEGHSQLQTPLSWTWVKPMSRDIRETGGHVWCRPWRGRTSLDEATTAAQQSPLCPLLASLWAKVPR